VMAVPDPIALPPLKCKNYNSPLEDRLGVMLHYDDSTDDKSAMAWFTDPRCEVSYNILVLDDGRYVLIVPEGKRAWHAGHCKSTNSTKLPYRDANSAFIGIAVATNGRTPATPAQVDTVAWLVGRAFDKHGWPRTESWRIVGHDTQAIWPNKPDVPKELRGKRGRKIDPTGPRADRPILSVDAIRQLVAAAQL
jgi:N-acetyl-anhydromuramyl-L-alanine amidase AmpD